MVIYKRSGNHCGNIWDCWIKSPPALRPLQNLEKWDKMALFGGFSTTFMYPSYYKHQASGNKGHQRQRKGAGSHPFPQTRWGGSPRTSSSRRPPHFQHSMDRGSSGHKPLGEETCSNVRQLVARAAGLGPISPCSWTLREPCQPSRTWREGEKDFSKKLNGVDVSFHWTIHSSLIKKWPLVLLKSPTKNQVK